MPGEMYFSRGTSVFGLQYSESTSFNASQDVKTNVIYVASSSLNVSVDVILNEHHLREDGTLNLLQRQLENAPVWQSLMFSILQQPEKNKDILEKSDGDLRLTLRCELFHPILPDLAHAENVRFLQLLAIKYEYWSPHQAIYFEDIFDTLQYLLTSLMMNLEFKFPFIFSYYGKQLVNINYKSLIRNSTLLATPLDNTSVPDHNEILAAVLLKLQLAILYEFNTLNIMKECESRPWQAKLCHKSTSVTGNLESRKSIKLKGVDLRPLLEVLTTSAEQKMN